MPEWARLRQDVIQGVSRIASPLPGPIGGLGTYFAAQALLGRKGKRHAWRRDVDALLARSDRALAEDRVDVALSWFDKALRLSYHPALHGSGGSPLAADPVGFLRPLRASGLGAVMFDTPVSLGSTPHRPAPRERDPGDPVRVLVIAQSNWTFIRPILQALEDTGRYEIREFEVDDLPPGERPEREQILRGRYDLVADGSRMRTPTRLAEAYDWADVAFVEWGHHILTWVTLLDRAPRRLVARYHRFEAFTPFPLLHDYARIDQILHVSPPVKNLVDRIVPAQQDVDTVYVGNLLRRGLGEVPHTPRDTHVLVQVGWNREIKDTLFSFDIIERLRQHDSRYRLQLVGPGLPDSPAHDDTYQRRVRARLAALGPEAVEQMGVRRDVPAIFAAAGFVLSSSNGEGTHESVMEGLATGCPAVIRDWPDAVGYGGAASIYREDWVAAGVEGIVCRVLELQNPKRYAEESRDARAWAIVHRHPDQVIAQYEQALSPGASLS